MEDKINWVGRLILGFQYANKPGTNSFVPSMKPYIGKIGIVVDESVNAIRVKFGDDKRWWYPKDEAIKHIGGEIIEPEINIKDLVKQIQSL